jgi:hypothetical protein
MPPPSILRRRGARSALVGVMVCLLAACTSAGSEDGDEGEPGSSVDRSSEAGEQLDASEWEAVVMFNEALVSENYEQALALAAPDSAAQSYVNFRIDAGLALNSAIEPVDSVAGTVTVDDGAQTITATIPIAGEDLTYTWSDFGTEDGLIQDWDTEQGPLEDRLWTGTSTVSVGAATVSLASAFKTFEDELYVVLEVTALRERLTPDVGAGYLVEGEELRLPVLTLTPADIREGTSAMLLYSYEDADLGGTLVYEVQTDFDAPSAVELAVD